MRPDPAFKTDENGRPVLKASYVMRRDPRAKVAYDALRRRGMFAKDAESTIEDAFQRSFTEVLLAEAYEEGPRGELARDRRKAEIWLSLREGLSVDSIFPQPAVETNLELTERGNSDPTTPDRRPVVRFDRSLFQALLNCTRCGGIGPPPQWQSVD